MLVRLRENLSQAAGLFAMLWYHGSFPLSVVTYVACGAFVLGVIIGHLL